MSGLLSHAVSQVIRQLLIDLGHGADGGTTWPVYADQTADKPDNLISVHNSAGRDQGRHMFGGEIQEVHGVQVDVRASVSQLARVKANQIKKGLSEDSHLVVVTVTDDEQAGTGTQDYTIYNVKWVSGPLFRPDENSNRKIWSTNFLITIRES